MSDASTDPSTPSAGGSAPKTPTGPFASAQWPARAADLVEEVVSAVHDRVIRPLLLTARALVFGLLVGTMVLVLAILVAVAVVRVLDTYAFGHRVWASDLLVGALFTFIGLVAWSRRKSGRTEER